MSKQTGYDKRTILGLEIDVLSLSQAVDYCIFRAGPGQPAGYVIKPYVEFFDRAYRNVKLQRLLNAADLSLADGVAIIWAAHYLSRKHRTLGYLWLSLAYIIFSPKKLRTPLSERTSGINFTLPLLEAAARTHLRVFLIGYPKDGRGIARTGSYLKRTIPGLVIAGTMSGRDPKSPSGHLSSSWYTRALTSVSAAKPDLILVGLGFPLQEEVCAFLSSRTAHGIYIGEGGSFDYTALGGHLAKAPAWVQYIGLEWFWRLLREPRRLGRQLAIPRFIACVYHTRNV